MLYAANSGKPSSPRSSEAIYLFLRERLRFSIQRGGNISSCLSAIRTTIRAHVQAHRTPRVLPAPQALVSLHFLNSAKALLSRTGKPMHYETITNLALKLGVLESSSRTPEVIMSSTLSREAAKHPQSDIKKVRPGVYELLPGASISPEIGDSHCLGARVHALLGKLTCVNELAILRRAFYILRQCSSVAGPPGKFKLGDGITDVDLDFLDPRTIRTKRDDLIPYRNTAPHAFHLDRTLIQAGEDLRVRLGLCDLDAVVDLAVSLTEIASRLHSDGFIIVSGPFDCAMIRIARPT